MSDRRSPELRRTAARRNARAGGGAVLCTAAPATATAIAMRVVIARTTP
ncbi:hypothetical protein [Rhodoplanes sp. SY1]